MTSDPARIEVRPAGESAYQVVVGQDVLGELPDLVAAHTRAVILHPRALHEAAAGIAGQCRRTGVEVHTIEVPDGEDAKSLRCAELCWEVLGRIGVTRDDVVVGLGGGAVTDLAGFVAATWLRGVAVVQVPTTLLGMVDAAIGGKTAVNSEAGKNLVGAFHQPLAVLCDLAVLGTLPSAEFTPGLAEVAKVGFIGDPVVLDLLDDDPTGAAHLAELVERSARLKADIVSADPREAGRREVLNYGHTLGHAIEKVERYTWRHGAAVSVGMIYAAALGRLAGRLDERTAARHRSLLERVGLPTSYAAEGWPKLLDAMRVDKKARGRRLRFVVLDGLAKPGVLEDPEPQLLAAAFREVAK